MSNDAIMKRIEHAADTAAALLRTQAAIHLAHALRREPSVTTADERLVAALVAGVEPEAST